MIAALKAFGKRHWPALHLRTILFSVLLFAAAMPGIGALFLRVYENALVRQTEAELVAQGAVLAAVAAADWPGAPPYAPRPAVPAPDYYRPEFTTIDLSRDPVLPERPPPPRTRLAGDPAAYAAGRRMAQVIEATLRTTLASAALTDRNGVVVYGAGLGGDDSALPEVRAALGGQPETVVRLNGDYHPRYRFEWLSRASGLRLHHARPIVVGGEVVGAVLLSRSPRALFRGIYEDRGKIALGVVGIFGLLVLLSGLISRGVARPIEALSRASRDVAAGGGTVPETPATAAVEIRALYEDFRAMAARIERRSGYLRDFAAAVSHEFKTPLAGINGAVELLQDHFETMSDADRRRFLTNIAADGDRLSKLVTRLLDLARADMASGAADAAVDLTGPVRRAADAEAGAAFDVRVDLPTNLPLVAVPASTLDAVLTILLQNSRQAGAACATVAARAGRREVVLSVTDNGPGAPTADHERLFEPFFTSRRAAGGTGLGLSIARSLLAANAATVVLAASPEGARFEVSLPCARDGR